MTDFKDFLKELNDDMSNFSETKKRPESSPIKHKVEDFLPTKRKGKMTKTTSLKNSKTPIVKLQRLPGAILPEAKTKEAAGYDLCANNNFPIIIRPGEHKTIPTGIKMEIPDGWCAEVYSRSGIAAKNGMFVLNSPGLLDSDYRGEIMVILANFGLHEFEVKRGDRIAQLRVKKLDSFVFEEVDSLSETERGEGGLGSTGV